MAISAAAAAAALALFYYQQSKVVYRIGERHDLPEAPVDPMAFLRAQGTYDEDARMVRQDLHGMDTSLDAVVGVVGTMRRVNESRAIVGRIGQLNDTDSIITPSLGIKQDLAEVHPGSDWDNMLKGYPSKMRADNYNADVQARLRRAIPYGETHHNPHSGILSNINPPTSFASPFAVGGHFEAPLQKMAIANQVKQRPYLGSFLQAVRQ